ncbi:amidohydrolase [Leptospira sp. GIMC2001]|uniref:amidohydrolase n=1 Tax=Leptospira sp. GIMC2001 TaxID=1513297 RepID=UPI0023493342|nr:amidohydrolase [Leptospira sp. GIMC2001]WCL47992.1 amidohydrolase [Leptospira sp. GIMC2001]
MKISFYQKKIGEKFTSQEKLKISKEKSDFLILPPRLILPLGLNEDNWLANYDNYLDQILELSETYKGVILGGTLLRKDSRGKRVESVPIVQGVNLIDHYDLVKPSISSAVAGDSETIFIMAGVRFAIITGNEIDDSEFLNDIKSKGIQTIFVLESNITNRTYEEELEYFSDIAKKYSFNIFRVCGYNQMGKILGRSLVATPTGIHWKVGKMEEFNDILKTIHFAQANPFL